MPRVSDQHLAARRQQILAAARACFTRSGFHATTMQDVIKEAGLSVGAVYRYFQSKEELIAAIVGDVADEIRSTLHQVVGARPRLALEDALRTIFTAMEPEFGPDGLFRVAVQVWSESLVNDALRPLILSLFARLRGEFEEYAEGLAEEGRLPAGVSPKELSAVLLALAQGYGLQRVFTGGPSISDYLAGVAGLTRLAPPPAH
jgi:AcrR family transcriptional regulator